MLVFVLEERGIEERALVAQRLPVVVRAAAQFPPLMIAVNVASLVKAPMALLTPPSE